MATPGNPNNNQQNQGGQQSTPPPPPPPIPEKSDDTIRLREALKDLIDEQGDYNNLLKSAVKELKKFDDAYEKIEARIQNLGTDTINLKEISNELYKSKQNEWLQTKKLQNLQKEFSAREEISAKKKMSGVRSINDALGNEITNLAKVSEYMSQHGNATGLTADEFTKVSIQTKKTETELARISRGFKGNINDTIELQKYLDQNKGIITLSAEEVQKYNKGTKQEIRDEIFKNKLQEKRAEQLETFNNQRTQDFQLLKESLEKEGKSITNQKHVTEFLEKQAASGNKIFNLSGQTAEEFVKMGKAVGNTNDKTKISAQYQKQIVGTQNEALISARLATIEQMKQAQQKGITLDYDDLMLENLGKIGDLEAIQLYTAEKQVEIAKKKTEETQAILEKEKQYNKNLGITGYLFKRLSENFGVGETVFGAMVEESKKLQTELDLSGKKANWFDKLSMKTKIIGAGFKAVGGKMKEALTDPAVLATGVLLAAKGVSMAFDGIGNAARKTGQFIAGLSKHTGDTVQNLTKGVSSLISKIPLIGGLLSGIVDGASALFDLLLGVDGHAQKVGRSLGKSEAETNKIKKNLIEAEFASGKLFDTTDNLLDSWSELAGVTGLNNEISNDRLSTDIELNKLAGYDLETRGKLLDISRIQNTNQKDIVKGVMAQTVGLRRLTGIELNNKQIMKELTGLSGYLGLQFAKYPEKLAKSLVVTKALGMDLKKLDSMAGSLLDFESSISKEFEAQLLTGKEVNLQKARELLLNNDLAGAAVEISKELGSSEEYLNTNRIAADSWAEALGMSRDEVADMLFQQDKLVKAQKVYGADAIKNQQDLKEKINLLITQNKEQEAINILGSKEAYQAEVRANSQEKLAAAIERIQSALVGIIQQYGIMEKLSEWINILSSPGTIKGIIGTIKNAVADFTEFVSGIIADSLEFIGDLWGTDEAKWDARAAKVRSSAGSIADTIRGMGEDKETKVAIKKQGAQRREEEDIQKLQEEAQGANWKDWAVAGGLAILAGALPGIGTVAAAGLYTAYTANKIQKGEEATAKLQERGIPVEDYVLKSLPQDTIVGAGGTKLGRTDEMVELLQKQSGQLDKLIESKKSMNVDLRLDKIDLPKLQVEPFEIDIPRLQVEPFEIDLPKLQVEPFEIDMSDFTKNITVSIIDDISKLTDSIINRINSIDLFSPEKESKESGLPSREVSEFSAAVDQMKRSGGGLGTKSASIENEVNYEYVTINKQMAEKDNNMAALVRAIEGLKTIDRGNQSRPQVNINQDIKFDPITGPKIVTQVDQGGGDESKFLNPVSQRG